MKSLHVASFVFGCLLLSYCSKKDNTISPRTVDPTDSSARLGYGETVFYVQNAAYTVMPTGKRTKGTYSAFPENLPIDPVTGKITVAAEDANETSLAGLWYKIVFTSDAGVRTDSTNILIAGVNYADKFYMTASDTLIRPIYNGDTAQAMPTGYFQSDNSAFPINAKTGVVNIKKIDYEKLFNGESWKDVTIRYSLNDRSDGVENRIKLILYNYPSWDTVPSLVSKIMQSHQHMTIGLQMARIDVSPGTDNSELPNYFKDFDVNNYRTWKPRPPCVVIVGVY